MKSFTAAGPDPHRLFVALALLLVSQPAFAATTIDYADAEKRADGLTYERGTDKPFSGVVRDNNRDGSPRSAFSFVDGRRDGVSTRWHRNGNKQSEETYVAGELHGMTTRWSPSGELQFKGNFAQGQPAGSRTDYYQNGNPRSERSFEDGLGNGPSTKWFESGQIQEQGVLVDGKYHGIVTTWHENGQKRSEEHWEHGQQGKEGPITTWHTTGKVYKQGHYEAGEFTGETKEYLSGGGLARHEVYVDGKRVELAHNIGTDYANGQQRGEQRWVDGVRQETLWHQNGEKERFSTIHPEHPDGVWQEWYDNGQKNKEYRSVYLFKEGAERSWYENGQLKSETNYWRGRKHGTESHWHEDGSEKSVSHWALGHEADANGQLLERVPVQTDIGANANTDVRYPIVIGSIRFWDTKIESVSDGRIRGNTAEVTPGAEIRLTGNWAVEPDAESRQCGGNNIQLYVAWVSGALLRGAWLPNHPLWKGQNRRACEDPPPSGTFDWSTQAPTEPGVYYIGRGESRNFTFIRSTEGSVGVATGGTDDVPAASFRIEVRTK